MSTEFRSKIEGWLAILASDAEAQLTAVNGLPEELRLTWEALYFAIDDRDPASNQAGIAQFSAAERAALNEFNDYLWSLPPESHPMWDRTALPDEPWTQVRARSAKLLKRLRTSR